MHEPKRPENRFIPEFQDNEPRPENAQDLLMEHLSFTPVSVDELIRTCVLSISTVQLTLLEMELAGRLKRHPGNRVSLTGND
jgi:DNA processing protein